MAITVLEQPQKFSPCGNDIVFTFQTDNDNVRYFVVNVLDLAGNTIASRKAYITPTEKNTAFIDISKALSSKVFTNVDISDSIVTLFDSGMLGYKLSIKEETNGNTLTTDTFYTYNAKLNDVWFYDYSYDNFVIKPDNEAYFLTRRGMSNILHISGKYFLYFILNTKNALRLNINVTYVDGRTANFREAIQSNKVTMGRINISPDVLLNTYEMPSPLIRSFDVWISNGSTPVTKRYKYRVTGYPDMYQEVVMCWTNSEGGTESYVFVNPVETKASERTTHRNSKRFAITNGIANSKTNIISSNMSSVYSVYSLMLSDLEYNIITDIINSEQVYVVLSNGVFMPVEIVDTSVPVLGQTTHKGFSRKLNVSFRADSNMVLNADVAGSIGSSFITQPKIKHVIILAIDGIEDGTGILD